MALRNHNFSTASTKFSIYITMASFNIANHLLEMNKTKRFTIDNINISEEVRKLKNEVAKVLGIPESEIELVYCGKCLKDSQTIESQNLKPGVTIHVLKALKTSPKQSIPKLEPSEIQRLIVALRTAILNPVYRETLQRLSKPETLENIIAATPGLAEDPLAIAILQDPELLFHLADINSINRVVEAHPALAEAMNHVAAAIHEDTSTSSGSAAHMLASAYLYSWDTLSDDDDDDIDVDHAVPNASLLQSDGQLAFPTITQAQLASALAAVASGGSIPTSQQSERTLQPMDSSSSMITPELFSQAVQEALSATTQAHLQQLRDMGISDDALSLRALEITGGDVHAALELIFDDGVSNDAQNPHRTQQ